MKKRFHTAAPLVMFSLLLILAVGCATDKGAVQRKDVPTTTLTEKGVSVTMDYLTNDELIAKFGKDNNPFIPPRSAIGINQGIALHRNDTGQKTYFDLG